MKWGGGANTQKKEYIWTSEILYIITIPSRLASTVHTCTVYIQQL